MHPLITYAEFSEKLHFLTIDTRKNFRFSENFAYVLNGFPLNGLKFLSYGNQSLNLQNETIDWFPYDGNIRKWVNVMLTSRA